MCEYCGCQALDAIAELTAEHDAVVELGGQARRALDRGDLDRAADRARAIAAVLRPHTAVEEEALFPAMAAEFPGTSTSSSPTIDGSRGFSPSRRPARRPTRPGRLDWPMP